MADTQSRDLNNEFLLVVFQIAVEGMISCDYTLEDGRTSKLNYRELQDLRNKLVLISDQQTYGKYAETFTEVQNISQ